METEDIKRICKAAFPSYRGRRYGVKYHATGRMGTLSYWDGGSRDTFAIVDLASLKVTPIAGINPLNPPAGWRDGTEIPGGCAIVEHSIFMGKDSGCTLHLRAPESECRRVDDGTTACRVCAAPTADGRDLCDWHAEIGGAR